MSRYPQMLYDHSMNGSSTITLYVREGCHLCEDAEESLRRLGLPVDRIDIDTDAALRARYTDLVPVIAIGGQTLLSGVIRESDLRRALAAALGG